ncbi:hypothetical protein CPC08DRAFT_770291 [Agrocybe pediades]|nr:hypothetical protein CPC08DRAFT_770291 [Agrocybe pediades]
MSDVLPEAPRARPKPIPKRKPKTPAVEVPVPANPPYRIISMNPDAVLHPPIPDHTSDAHEEVSASNTKSDSRETMITAGAALKRPAEELPLRRNTRRRPGSASQSGERRGRVRSSEDVWWTDIRWFGCPLASQRESLMRNKPQTHACPLPSPVPGPNPDGTSKKYYASTDDDEDSPLKAFNTTLTRRQGETIIVWFLPCWGPISETLFDVVEGTKTGLFRRPVVRRDSFRRDVLVSAAASAAERREEEDVGKGGRSGSGSSSGYSKGSKMPVQSTTPPGRVRVPTIRVAAAPRIGPTPQIHSTPRKAAAARAADEVTDDDDENDYVVLSSAHASAYHQISAQRGQVLPTTLSVGEILVYHRGKWTEGDDDSFYSLLSIDERRMHVSMPRSLMNDTTLMNTFHVGGSAQEEPQDDKDEISSNTADVLPPSLNPNPSPPRLHLAVPIPPLCHTAPAPSTPPNRNESDLHSETATRVYQLEQELRARTAKLSDVFRELKNSVKSPPQEQTPDTSA